MDVLLHPNFDPAAVVIFGRPIAWYGLMYLLGFVAAYLLGKYRAKQSTKWQSQEIDDLIFLGALSVIVGGRLGYMLFYDWPHHIPGEPDHWWEFIEIWKGGMSFHGGALAIVLAIWFFSWRTKVKSQHPRSYLQVADFAVPLAPLGIFAGRMGNFINQELWGREAGESALMSMKFPLEAGIAQGADVTQALIEKCLQGSRYVVETFHGNCQTINDNAMAALNVPARHVSQLYEAATEGLLLFLILWLYSRKPRPVGSVAAFFLIFYGLFRAFCEYFRKPDEGIDFLWGTGWLTEGMLLSMPMVLAGLAILALSLYLHQRKDAYAAVS